MDNIPIEYHDRMMAEQIAMMGAFQLIFQILICFVILITIVVLIVNISDIVQTRLSDRRASQHLQAQSRAHRRAALRSRSEKIEHETETERQFFNPLPKQIGGKK